MTCSRAAILAFAMAAVACGGQSKRKAPTGRRPPTSCDCPPDGGLGGAGPDATTSPAPGSNGRRPQFFSLLAAAKSYQSHSQCVATVTASLPPELTREADEANLAERICQTRRALAEKSASLCEEITDPFWPMACRRLFAALYGKPDDCPHRTPRHRGRDALCVALATRDPALCAAVDAFGGQVRCRAILGRPSVCRAMRTTAELTSCLLDRKRWRSVLKPTKPSLAPKYAPRFELQIVSKQTTLRGESKALDRGVVVPAAGRLMLGSLQPVGRPSAVGKALAVLVDLPPPGKLPAKLPVGAGAKGARFCALWLGRPVLPSMATGQVELTSYGTTRGARIVGTWKVRVERDGETAEISATFDTFVRDTVPATWAGSSCQERLASLVSVQATPAQPTTGPTSEHPCYFVAHWEGLRKVGYRAYGVRKGGACARLGLRAGDVVLTVAARPLRQWSDVLAFYQKLASAAPLQVTVRRRKKRVVLRGAR
ncbi:MAG: hypothetical protein ABI333_07825 [bacterium]